MIINRREALMKLLFGAGAIGLRSLATGIPAAFLLNPRKAAAAGTCLTASKAQYFIFSTSGGGDPINANCPGTYADANIVHPADPQMTPASVSLNGKSFTAATPWSTLPQWALDRTVFWHLMTNTPVHPKEPDVLKLMGATPDHEMLPSLLAKAMAPCLSTIQAQPIAVGASGPSEALLYDGAPLPIIPPVALKDTLTNAAGPLTNLMSLRDSTMNSIYALYKNGATPAEKAFIDATANTQSEARSLNQSLMGTLANIKDNSTASQITAAITLIQMNVAPVISIHVPFGGDNHSDGGLATETAQTVQALKDLNGMLTQLQSAGLQDKVTFFNLNVFGRTLKINAPGTSATTGRNHNGNHQVSVTIGKPFLGGVVGGVGPVSSDYGATGIDSTTGASTSSGDVSPAETLGAFAKSMLAAVGADTSGVTYGKVITSNLA